VQLFRSGIVESVNSTEIATGSGLPTISNIDDKLIQEARRCLGNLAKIGVEPPYVLLVSLLGVAGARFSFARGPYLSFTDDLSNKLERDQYYFDDVLFESVPSSKEQCAEIIRPTLDQIANAGGKAMSPVFDTAGRYISLDRS